MKTMNFLRPLSYSLKQIVSCSLFGLIYSIPLYPTLYFSRWVMALSSSASTNVDLFHLEAHFQGRLSAASACLDLTDGGDAAATAAALDEAALAAAELK